jgi:hypothetical protein
MISAGLVPVGSDEIAGFSGLKEPGYTKTTQSDCHWALPFGSSGASDSRPHPRQSRTSRTFSASCCAENGLNSNGGPD